MSPRSVNFPQPISLRFARRVRRHFQGERFETRSIRTVLHDQWLRTERLALIVRISYGFPAFWMTTLLLDWQELVDVKHPMWLWPVAWLGRFDGTAAPKLLLITCVAGAWLSSAFCAHRWARVVAVVALVEVLGLRFATGKIHHLMHGWGFLLATFVALPQSWHNPLKLTRAERVQALLIYGLAQSLFALTYALSGAGKLLGVVYQALRGEVTALHPQAFSRHVAARLLETADESLLGGWVILHGAWLWPLVLSTMYLQLFALHFAARPHLHRLLAFGLVGFHGVSAATLHIDFTPAIVLASLLFGASATAPVFSLRRVATELPLFGGLLARVMAHRTQNFHSRLMR